MRGVRQVESKYVWAKSNGGGSMNLLPSYSVIKSKIAGMSLSGLSVLRIKSLWKELNLSAKSFGRGFLWGSVESYISFQIFPWS